MSDDVGRLIGGEAARVDRRAACIRQVKSTSSLYGLIGDMSEELG